MAWWSAVLCACTRLAHAAADFSLAPCRPQATKHEYAITYNDNSVLESHHVAAAWRVLLQDDCNFLKALSREQYLELREMVIQFVLGTDMKFHFEHLTKFKTKVSADVFKKDTEREDVKYLLAVLMHTGDIANPAKPMGLCLKWTEVVMEEFFQQGDLERKMKMPVSPFFDRDQTSVAQCQMGFINILVLPLYTEVTNLLGEPARTECFGALKANLSGADSRVVPACLPEHVCQSVFARACLPERACLPASVFCVRFLTTPMH